MSLEKKVEPRIPAGFMELTPQKQLLFSKMMQIIRGQYELFGFIPLDTPVIELSEILLAKAGGETEKQIYNFKKGDTDLSLRFDLTVPLSRFVAMNQNELAFPFRRYQIGKVYRGERPQKGRFREFYQCDIDIIGNEKLDIVYDAEIPYVMYNILKKLGINEFTIKINNRKILSGFFEYLNLTEKITEILRIVDKIEKISEEEFITEIINLGVEKNIVSKILEFVKIKKSNNEVMSYLKNIGVKNEIFDKGIEELELVLSTLNGFGVEDSFYTVDLTIARGLDYYTGTIYETIIDKYPEIGSICSGGRYDGLANNYTNKNFPGVGMSIGLTRLFDQLDSKSLLCLDKKTTDDVLIIYMDDQFKNYSLNISNILRNNGIATEIYFDNCKFKNKMNYANKIAVPYVAIIGENEFNTNSVAVKNMETGEQNIISLDNLVIYLKEYLNFSKNIVNLK